MGNAPRREGGPGGRSQSYASAAGLSKWLATPLRAVGDVDIDRAVVEAVCELCACALVHPEMVTPMDLPNELELLQLIDGDDIDDRIPCFACRGTGHANECSANRMPSSGSAPSSAGPASSLARTKQLRIVNMQRESHEEPFGFSLQVNARGDILVTRVTGTAEVAGLRVGDVVININDREIVLMDFRDVKRYVHSQLTLDLHVSATRLSVLHQLARDGNGHASELLKDLVNRDRSPWSSRLDKRSTLSATWLHEDGAGGWSVFEPQMACALESGWSEGRGVVLHVQGPVFEYKFDLEAMEQTNVSTGATASILRLQDESTNAENTEEVILLAAHSYAAAEAASGNKLTYMRVKQQLIDRFGMHNFDRVKAAVRQLCIQLSKSGVASPLARPAPDESQGNPSEDQSMKWYWQADAAELVRPGAPEVEPLQPGNYIGYSTPACQTLETAYQAWLTKHGPPCSRVREPVLARQMQSDPGTMFEVDFRHWTQHNLNTGTTRSVLRCKSADDAAIGNGGEHPRWEYRKVRQGCWIPFDQATNAAIDAAYLARVPDERTVMIIGGSHTKFKVDLNAFAITQVGCSEVTTAIRRTEAARVSDDALDNWEVIIGENEVRDEGQYLAAGNSANLPPGSEDVPTIPQVWQPLPAKVRARLNVKEKEVAAAVAEDGEQAHTTGDDDDWTFVLDHDVAVKQGIPTERLPCWVCRGTGRTSKWLSPAACSADTVGRMDHSGAYDCMVCFDPEGQYRLSTKCSRHFYCQDCIRGALGAILESGQFPAICPACRAEAPDENERRLAGQIDDAALSFLQRRGIIDREMLFRLKKASLKAAKRDDETQYFACPHKCGRHLLTQHASYAGREPGKLFEGGEGVGVRLGRCPCGGLVCTVCHLAQTDDGPHACLELLPKVAMSYDPATERLIKKLGKRCPACGTAVIKNGGCDVMMCGTTAHGKVRDAIQNGGCAYIFHWGNLAEIDTDRHTNIHGVKVTESPVTDRQVLLPRTKRYIRTGNWPARTVFCDQV